jgi:serine/threonine protein kinase
MIMANKDVIGGAYPKKEINWQRVHEMARRGAPAETLASIGSNYVFNIIGENKEVPINEPVEVTEVGTGLMLIKRSVLEKMRDHYNDWYIADDNINAKKKVYRFFDTQVVNNRYLSEDYMFSHRWREMGGKIYLASWTRTHHSGSYSYVGDIPQTSVTMARITSLESLTGKTPQPTSSTSSTIDRSPEKMNPIFMVFEHIMKNGTDDQVKAIIDNIKTVASQK